MKQSTRTWPTILVAALAVGGAIAASASSGTTCCVANPRFAGICAVELGEDETCADVLRYLNTANTVGKTYCGGTDIRGGWKQVSCQEEED